MQKFDKDMEKLEEFFNYKKWVELHTYESISAAHSITDDKYLFIVFLKFLGLHHSNSQFWKLLLKILKIIR